MPTKNPRINVVLEKASFRAVREMARREGTSLSTVTRDLIKEALDLREDAVLADWGEARLKTLDRKKLADHKDAWRKK